MSYIAVIRRAAWPRIVMFASTLLLIATGTAQAHVKWFAHYDVAQTPLALGWLTSTAFVTLTCIAFAAVTTGVLVENSVIGRYTLRALNRTTAPILRNAELIMRATFGAFFVALWTVGGIILTPELLTTERWISWVQLAIAACFLWRPTLVVAAVGIVGLYAYGVHEYGIFHMLDYPIFLGGAVYFALLGAGVRPGARSPLDLLRYATGITLMWASVEKWAYPDWTYPLFASHPEMGLGFQPRFYMLSAGVVEFSLALALLGPPLVRRAGAIMLATTFVTAILEFGKIDAIGHSAIIAVLLAVIADDTPARRRWAPAIVPVCYLGALAVTIASYYLLHQALFPVEIGTSAIAAAGL